MILSNVFDKNLHAITPESHQSRNNNEHSLLHGPMNSILLQDLFDQLSDMDGFNIVDVHPKELCPLLYFDTVANRIVIEAPISYIKALARLD